MSKCEVCNEEIKDEYFFIIKLHTVHESTHESFVESVRFHKKCSFTKAQQVLTDHLLRTYMVNKS